MDNPLLAVPLVVELHSDETTATIREAKPKCSCIGYIRN